MNNRDNRKESYDNYYFSCHERKSYKLKKDIVDEIAERTYFRKEDIAEVYDTLVNMIVESIFSCGYIKIGPIILDVKKMPDRKNYSYSNKTMYHIPSRFWPRVTLSSSIKRIFKKKQEDYIVYEE